MSGDIYIAVCTLGNVRAEWAVGLASMHQTTGRTRHLALIKHMGIADARNFAVNIANSIEAEYLLFWDDDVVPKLTDASSRLFSALDQHPEIDVIGGVYPMRRFLPEPVCVKDKGGGVYWGWQDGEIHQVYMVGTGFMAIRLASLRDKTTPEPYTVPGAPDYPMGRYFNIEDDGGGGVTTDDFWFAGFCDHWRLKQYVHGGVVCHQIDRETGEYSRIEEAEAVVA